MERFRNCFFSLSLDLIYSEYVAILFIAIDAITPYNSDWYEKAAKAKLLIE
jgi:hypothetical protein